MQIGILALQGAVTEHVRMIRQCGANAIAIKQVDQLRAIDGLIIPGGESTTIAKLMQQYGFFEGIRTFAQEKRPIMGTCAGLILLARQLTGQRAYPLQLLDVTVTRNAYGRQQDSFEAKVLVPVLDQIAHGVFIRAPQIVDASAHVAVLGTYEGQRVIVRQDNVLGITFHPELTDEAVLHDYFLGMVRHAKGG
jgi:5'-phosphate synthase pdxT subunit